MSKATEKISEAVTIIVDGVAGSSKLRWVSEFWTLMKTHPLHTLLVVSLATNLYMGWMTFVQPRLDFSSRRNVTEAIDLTNVKNWQDCILSYMETDTPGREIYNKCKEYEE